MEGHGHWGGRGCADACSPASRGPHTSARGQGRDLEHEPDPPPPPPKRCIGRGRGLRGGPKSGSAGGWRRLPKRLGAVTVGYKCHRGRNLASGGQWLGIGWALWRGGVPMHRCPPSPRPQDLRDCAGGPQPPPPRERKLGGSGPPVVAPCPQGPRWPCAGVCGGLGGRG